MTKEHGHTHPLRAEAFAAIKRHLAEHGSKNWKLILDRYGVKEGEMPSDDKVHIQTIWGWIRKAKNDVADAQLLSAAKAAIEAEVPRLLPAEAAKIGRDLPMAPSPNYIAKSGDGGMRRFDMVRELEGCYSDALMLRAYAVTMVTDPETQVEREKIKNPVVFEKQLSRRLDVMDTTLRAMKEVWDLRAMQGFYEVVVEEIGNADPATQQRIMARLADLNARTGMNMNMRV